MTKLKLYYATNRKHEGKDRWHPESYGTKFSDDGMENLRFGAISVEADQKRIDRFLGTDLRDCGTGDGEGLGGYFAKCAEGAKTEVYRERIGPGIAETAQKNVKLGSKALFADVMSDMESASDALIYIHGFNVSWHSAVGSALALQTMLRNAP